MSVNDLCIERSVDEVIRIVSAIQYADKYGTVSIVFIDRRCPKKVACLARSDCSVNYRVYGRSTEQHLFLLLLLLLMLKVDFKLI